jgi:zinc protease
LLKQIDLTLNASDRVGLQLSEWMAMGDWRLFFLHRDRIKKVTPADVQRVAAAYLKPSNRTVGLFVPTPKPDRSEMPPAPDVPAMLKDYKGDTQISAGEAFDPSPENIESRTKRPTTPAGLKLALLSKKTRGGNVLAFLTLRFGDEKTSNQSIVADLAGRMLLRGTTNTRQQIQDEFISARVGVFGGAGSANVSIETTQRICPPSCS